MTETKPLTEPILVPISPGELIDKITILEIKSQRMTDPAKLANVRRELELLEGARDERVDRNHGLEQLAAELREVNLALWDIEDEIRGCEAEAEFGPRFVELARNVYQSNDRRAALKLQINLLLGSELVEEKDYKSYEDTGV